MYKRVNEAPKSPKELNPDLPDWLVRVVMKCLERLPDNRYQSAADILSDLQNAMAPVGSKSTAIAFTIRRVEVEMPAAKLGLTIAAAIVVIAAITLAIPSVRHRIFGGGAESSGPHKPVTILVADFTNHTGDPVLDGTLEPMMNTALEGASFITSYNRGSARKLAQKLPHATDKLDEQSARLIALSQGVTAVITGEITLRGGKYEVSAIALDAVTGNVLANASISVDKKEDILHDLPELAAPIRKALGDTTPPSVQLAAVKGGFSAASLEAVHYDAIGLEQQFAGNFQEAFNSFSKAVEQDPNYAGAYSGMAAMAANLGKPQDAEKYIKLALQHEDRMTERERYRTRGLYYISVNNWQKCAEELTQLVSRYPSDRVGQTNLAICYAEQRNFPKAAEVARKAVELVPKGATQRTTLAFYLVYTDDFESAEREAQTAVQLNPNSALAYMSLAEAQLGTGQVSQATETYKKLQALGSGGASSAAAGLADLAAYEGRFGDAVRILEQGVAADLEAKNHDSAAKKLGTLAHLQWLRGQKSAAVAAATKALTLSQDVPVRVMAAQAFLEAGDLAKAEKLAAGLASEQQPEPQAYAKMLSGRVALTRGDKNQAVKLLTDANNTLDTWIGRFELGRAYVEAGQFVEADSEFDRCLKRRGEELELFMDNVPTVAYLPSVYYYQGRVREGLKSAGFADAYRTYLSIRGQSAEDPLVPEVRRRLGSL
jgi:tetratricopeptide (TPR) repeat protein